MKKKAEGIVSHVNPLIYWIAISLSLLCLILQWKEIKKPKN